MLLGAGDNGAAARAPRAHLVLPATVPAGSYHLIACADSSSAVAETNETNHCVASASQLTVLS